MGKRGMVLTLSGGVLWGFGGVFGQYLIEDKGMTAQWMACARLLSAGILLLAFTAVRQKKDMYRVWKQPKDRWRLLGFGVLGLAVVQWAYYYAVAASNAGTATILQYTSAIWIMIYVSLRNRRLPKKTEAVALVLAVGGTFLLATHGRTDALALSREALFWGLTASLAMSLYNLIPGHLMSEYGSVCIVGWGMLIGGVTLSLYVKPWNFVGIWDMQTVGALFIVVVLGTVTAYSLYMEGVRQIGAKRASLAASMEPVTATLGVVLLMHVVFTPMDFLGFVCILGAVILCTLSGGQKQKEGR